MPARAYPWELYAEVAELLIDQLAATVALTGAASERELVERIYYRVRPGLRHAVLPLAGTLPFDSFCALIEAADLTITNNTGPMHISAAFKTPVVALFALTNPPEQWHPWRVPHRLLYHEVACRLCYSRACPYGHECLREVTPGRVVEAAGELLGTLQIADCRLQLEGTGEQSTIASNHALGQDWRLGTPALESEEVGWRLGAAWRLGG